ncbi:TolC family protein [Zhouia amylolytica]|uniref:Outer membrane protein TolC n=1 Tax=Zhouia amylolytica AD3 TaxID=1286632 RepID=W2UST9_9FLAO|nr:TolC family protein [Zhouia amylolytica]ETN96377.1 hypothetical protein P278_07210 [Zhouia amylolytica AD3]
MFLTTIAGYAQLKDSLTLDLNQVLEISATKSLESFKNKNTLLTRYWEYENYKIEGLPVIGINFEPLSYNNYTQEVYNYEQNRYEFRNQQTLNSNAGLNIQKNILATGGRLYLNSSVNRLETYGDNPSLSFNNNLFNIGFEQGLFNFNPYKWDKKIEPLQYEKAKKEYLESQQQLHVNAISYFFDLANAQLSYNMAQDNFSNADKLYKLGQKRFEIATINKEALLDLELNLLDSEVSLKRAQSRLKSAQYKLNSFLGFDTSRAIELKIPEEVPKLQLSEEFILDQAMTNNTQMLDIRLRELQSLKEVNRTAAERKFNPKFSGSVGLNKTSDTWPDTYQDPLNQQRVSLSIEIPLVDWGRRKRNNMRAERNLEITRIENEQTAIDFEQEVQLLVTDFNIQGKLVENARKASEVAATTHVIIMQRFMFGTVDIVRLNSVVRNKDNARNSYLQSLKQYWTNYYMLQMVTLTDLQTGIRLSDSFNLKALIDSINQ